MDKASRPVLKDPPGERKKIGPMYLAAFPSKPRLRRQSTGQTVDPPPPKISQDEVSADDGDPANDARDTGDHSKYRNRSRSVVDLNSTKDSWAQSLLEQIPVEEACRALKSTLLEFDRSAGEGAWRDVIKCQEHAVEAHQALNAKTSSRKPSSRLRKWIDQLGTTALEYTKLLDPLMQIAPNYAVAVWGSIKVILAMNISSAKIKNNIANSLVEIGNQLVLVNQIIAYFPRENILNDVAALYALLVQFLEKALKCQTFQQKAPRAILQYWDTTLKPLVDDIDAQFTRIERLAHMNHMQLNLNSHHMLCQILKGQHWDRQASGFLDDLGPLSDEIKHEFKGEILTEMRQEMRKAVQDLFKIFDTEWPARFDELVDRQADNQSAIQSGKLAWQLSGSTLVEDQNSIPDLSPSHFANLMKSAAETTKLVSELFPALKLHESPEVILRLKNRRLRSVEYQYITTVFRQPHVKEWMKDPHSGLLWLESRMDSRFTDWMAALMIELVEQTSQNSSNTVLRFFCQSSAVGQNRPSALIALQSLIAQAITLHHKALRHEHQGLFIQRFKEAQDRVQDLATLLDDILNACDARRVWLMVDRVGMLDDAFKPTGDLLGFIDCLNSMASCKDKVIKIIVTSRTGGPKWPLEAARASALADHHLVVLASKARGGRIRAQSVKMLRKSSQNSMAKTHSKPTSDVAERSTKDLLDSDSDVSSTSSVRTPCQILPVPILSLSKDYDTSDVDSDSFPHKDELASETSGTEGSLILQDDVPQHSDDSSDHDSLQILRPRKPRRQRTITFADQVDMETAIAQTDRYSSTIEKVDHDPSQSQKVLRIAESRDRQDMNGLRTPSPSLQHVLDPRLRYRQLTIRGAESDGSIDSTEEFFNQ